MTLALVLNVPLEAFTEVPRAEATEGKAKRSPQEGGADALTRP